MLPPKPCPRVLTKYPPLDGLELTINPSENNMEAIKLLATKVRKQKALLAQYRKDIDLYYKLIDTEEGTKTFHERIKHYKEH